MDNSQGRGSLRISLSHRKSALQFPAKRRRLLTRGLPGQRDVQLRPAHRRGARGLLPLVLGPRPELPGGLQRRGGQRLLHEELPVLPLRPGRPLERSWLAMAA